jgi:hypothetical protein
MVCNGKVPKAYAEHAMGKAEGTPPATKATELSTKGSTMAPRVNKSRSHHYKNLPLSPYGEMRLKLHVLSRNTYKDLRQRGPELYDTLDELRDTYRIGGEDVEMISIALLALIKTRSTITLVTVDNSR